MRRSISSIRWRYGIAVGIFVALLSLFPHFYLKYERGNDNNGATFFYDYDEVSYAAYLQALIDERPRKNGVYSGGGDPQQFETSFTIQFLPPFLISIPARAFGASSDTAFLFASAFFAFLTALTLYLLVHKITGNAVFSASATVFILLLAPVVAGISLLKNALGLGPSAFYLTFARRYGPAFATPLVFGFLAFVWLGLKSRKDKKILFYALSSGACFALLVYSYFFFWTALLGWIFCLVMFGLLLNPERTKKQFTGFWLPLGAFCLALCAPYFYLLTQRHETADGYLILEKTRSLLLFRPTLIFGCLTLLAAFALKRIGRLRLSKQNAVFVFSLLIAPVFVFNQQLVTGRSLQPHHYDMYVLNYLVLTALVLLFYFAFRRRLQKINSVWWGALAVLIFGWGLLEMNYTTRNRLWYNAARDEAIPVNLRLAQLSRENFAAATTQITMNFDSVQGNNQPTVAPYGVLWSEHMFFLANMSDAEHRRRYFSYLYYQNRDEKWLGASLRPCTGEPCRALFGWGTIKTLSIHHYVPTESEIAAAIEEYAEFIRRFNKDEATNPALSYVVAKTDEKTDFGKLDLWYERDAGEQYGKFTLYRVRTK